MVFEALGPGLELEAMDKTVERRDDDESRVSRLRRSEVREACNACRGSSWATTDFIWTGRSAGVDQRQRPTSASSFERPTLTASLTSSSSVPPKPLAESSSFTSLSAGFV